MIETGYFETHGFQRVGNVRKGSDVPLFDWRCLTFCASRFGDFIRLATIKYSWGI
jgi:hypothetical protein